MVYETERYCDAPYMVHHNVLYNNIHCFFLLTHHYNCRVAKNVLSEVLTPPLKIDSYAKEQ